jgi:hypothetical protein
LGRMGCLFPHTVARRRNIHHVLDQY